MKRFWQRYNVAWVVPLLLFAPAEGAEVKDEVIRELASDLAEIGRILSSEEPEQTRFPKRPADLAGAKVTVARTIPGDLLVAGKVEDLKPEAKASVKKTGIVRDTSYIATWATAFEADAPVFASGFTPKGTTQTLELREVKAPITWVGVEITEAMSWLEEKITRAIARAREMKKKYTEKGLTVKGFSVSVPVPSLSVNFEFE